MKGKLHISPTYFCHGHYSNILLLVIYMTTYHFSFDHSFTIKSPKIYTPMMFTFFNKSLESTPIFVHCLIFCHLIFIGVVVTFFCRICHQFLFGSHLLYTYPPKPPPCCANSFQKWCMVKRAIPINHQFLALNFRQKN